MKNLTWKLFKETGDIKYYFLYLKFKGEEDESSDRMCLCNRIERC